MPQKSNNRDDERAASPAPQEPEDELDTAEDEDFEEDADFDDEAGFDEDVEE